MTPMSFINENYIYVENFLFLYKITNFYLGADLQILSIFIIVVYTLCLIKRKKKLNDVKWIPPYLYLIPTSF